MAQFWLLTPNAVPEFNSWYPHGGRRESALETASISTVHHGMYMPTHIHSHPPILTSHPPTHTTSIFLKGKIYQKALISNFPQTET